MCTIVVLAVHFCGKSGWPPHGVLTIVVFICVYNSASTSLSHGTLAWNYSSNVVYTIVPVLVHWHETIQVRLHILFEKCRFNGCSSYHHRIIKDDQTVQTISSARLGAYVWSNVGLDSVKPISSRIAPIHRIRVSLRLVTESGRIWGLVFRPGCLTAVGPAAESACSTRKSICSSNLR